MEIKNKISSSLLRVTFFVAFAIILIFTMESCGNDEVKVENKPKANISMNMKSVPAEVMTNTSIYVFGGLAPNVNKFVEKQRNVRRENDWLKTNMNVGTWNLVLLSSNTGISNISEPNFNGLMSDYPMWETKKTTDGNYLQQTPSELRYAPLIGTVINDDAITTKSATLNRNVAKIQVILKEYTGFDQVKFTGTNPYAFVELLDVPTTLAWTGGLFPNKTTPTISDKAIREPFKFSAAGKADTVNFIVPAHRGVDAFDNVILPSDTSTHKLRLKASMPLNNASYFGKTPFKIPFVPKPNRIIQIVLTFRGEPNAQLDVKVTAKEWEDYIIQNEDF